MPDPSSACSLLGTLLGRALQWKSERGQISGSLASMRKHDAEGAKILREILKQFDAKIIKE